MHSFQFVADLHRVYQKNLVRKRMIIHFWKDWPFLCKWNLRSSKPDTRPSQYGPTAFQWCFSVAVDLTFLWKGRHASAEIVYIVRTSIYPATISERPYLALVLLTESSSQWCSIVCALPHHWHCSDDAVQMQHLHRIAAMLTVGWSGSWISVWSRLVASKDRRLWLWAWPLTIVLTKHACHSFHCRLQCFIWGIRPIKLTTHTGQLRAKYLLATESSGCFERFTIIVVIDCRVYHNIRWKHSTIIVPQ